MFQVNLGTLRNKNSHPFTVNISGCPLQGLAAVDFRRKYGLPEAPSSSIELPGYSFTDEAFVRKHKQFATDSADLELEHLRVPEYCVNADNQVVVCRMLEMSHNHVNYFKVTPEAARDYLQERSPETGKALWDAIVNYSKLSKERAQRARKKVVV